MRADATRSSQRTANLRTATILAAVAPMFFGGIIVAQSSGPSITGFGALGVAFIGFALAAMVGRVRA
jgi:hypothetical protein